MTCEDTTPVRLTWEIQLHEPCSSVWMCRGYGRATTTAQPADIARAVLAGYLAATPPRSGETFRALARPDTGPAVTVTADQLAGGAWETDTAVRQALPLYLRDALPERAAG
ncbi:hypothetical protein ACFYQT_39895 [Streptomyces tibetensis]|uniref:Uncharacterized protein n=1 Tax=Streptomyces tibetensis TaxID=2382123 RepID=A0ABW6N8P7_9ACTN